MTQFPPTPEPFRPPTQPYAGEFAPIPKTSGLAIASLVCGIVGLVACCSMVPSVLGVVFGGVALPPINRGLAGGRGLAVSGIILSVLGLLLGTGFWILFALSPEPTPVDGSAVSDADRATLVDLGVLQDGEEIELFYASGFFSIKEGGVVLTDQRLVIYNRGSDTEACDLIDIAALEYVPAANWFDQSQFTVELEDGEEYFFSINGQESGDRIFERKLRRKIIELRKAAGRPALRSLLTPIGDNKGKTS